MSGFPICPVCGNWHPWWDTEICAQPVTVTTTPSLAPVVVLETCPQCGKRVVDRWPVPESALVCCSRRCRAAWLADAGGYALDDGPLDAAEREA